MRRVSRILVACAWMVVLPSAVLAQGSITGVVRDTSGAVLPGVTVEASSPVLIEKVRSVVTDGTGQYRIVDLRPGSYTLSFMLPGFSVVRREGIELTAGFTATVNAEMRVGGPWKPADSDSYTSGIATFRSWTSFRDVSGHHVD